MIVANTFGIIGKGNKKIYSHVLSKSELENEKNHLKSGLYVCVKWNHFSNGSDEMIILENTEFYVY
jgi:hypothetical protein